MTQTTTIDGVSRTSVIKRVDCEWAESAYLGEIGSGSIKIHDDAGTISVVGHKTIDTEQTACTSWPTLFMGFVGQKQFARGQTYSVGAGREITCSTTDGNDLLTRYVIQGSGATNGNRPAETVGATVTWLLASTFLTGLVNDYGAVTYPSTLGMDATDYRGQRPGDVLAACAKKASFNFYVRWNVTNSGWELVFRDDNASTADTSTITITNDGTADSAASFAPFEDATLTQDPQDVYSGVYETYAKGAYYGTRAATATAFVARDGTAGDSGIKTSSAAQLEATRFLWDSHLEENTMTVTLRMRAAYVNLIRAGQRVSVKMTHFAQEGYGSATYFRVLRRRVRQPLDTDNDYDVQLDLSPQEAAAPAAKILQSVFGRTSEGGGYLTFANPVTVGSILVFAISDRGQTNPGSPNISGSLPNWGTGAWTRFNGATISASGGDGAAMYYKTADATSQQTYIGGTNCVVGAWEVSGGTPASASVVYVNSGTGTTSYPLGTLTSVLSTEVAMALWIFGDGDWPWGGPGAAPSGGYAWANIDNSPGLASGWTLRISEWAFDSYSSTYYKVEHPWATIADAVGTGASLAATITPGLSSKNFAGIAIRIPA